MAVRSVCAPGQPAGARNPLAARRGAVAWVTPRLTPIVTALIVINVVVYLWEMASHAGFYVSQGVPTTCTNMAQCRFAMWPAAVHEGQWYRLFTAAFLHANISHILFNMITLAIIGSPVEAELGKARFTGRVPVVSFGGSVASYL